MELVDHDTVGYPYFMADLNIKSSKLVLKTVDCSF